MHRGIYESSKSRDKVSPELHDLSLGLRSYEEMETLYFLQKQKDNFVIMQHQLMKTNVNVN